MKNYVDDGFILNLLQRGYSYKQISVYYQGLHPDVRGLSARSFRRYCKLNNLTRLSNERRFHVYCTSSCQQLRSLLWKTNDARQHTFFAWITAGAVSQRRVSRALQLVAPVARQARAQDTLERQNPVPYFATYFRYKGHFDQNEKSCSRLWMHTRINDRWLF